MPHPYSWQFFGPTGAQVDDVGISALTFPSQTEAETWMSEQWPTLADAGVDAVTLHRETEVVYGPMSLSP
jgi:hypothetical protein